MLNNPIIYIVGAGAIGKALAVFLKLAGKKVIIIRGSVDDELTETPTINVTLADGTVHTSAVKIVTLSSLNALNGIIVLTNKSYGNPQLATVLKDKIGSSPLVLLQNGLGIEKPFIIKGFNQVYRCVLFVTSQLIAPNMFRFKPITHCPIGIAKGNGQLLNQIVEILNTPHFRFKSEVNLQEIIWKKAIVNTIFNSICPLLEIDNGIFYRNKEVLNMARRIIVECTAIANARGIMLTNSDVEQSLLQISKLSDGQLISTLQDIRNNRKTEIATLNFEILRIAENLNKADSVKETTLLGELTKLKSEIKMGNGN